MFHDDSMTGGLGISVVVGGDTVSTGRDILSGVKKHSAGRSQTLRLSIVLTRILRDATGRPGRERLANSRVDDCQPFTHNCQHVCGGGSVSFRGLLRFPA